MIPLLLLAVLAVLVYGFWLAVRKWGTAAGFFVAAAVSVMGASGVMAEAAWGRNWSWNFAHHGRGYAVGALVQGIFWLVMGLRSRAQQRTSN